MAESSPIIIFLDSPQPLATKLTSQAAQISKTLFTIPILLGFGARYRADREALTGFVRNP